MEFNKICVVLVAMCFFTLGNPGSRDGHCAASSAGPQEQLRPTIDKMIKILDDPALKGDEKRLERRSKIMDAARERFDFAEMAKRALGKEWRRHSPDEKNYFVDLFTKLLEHAYIGKLEGYSGRTVTFQDQRIKGKRAVVRTTVPHNGKVIPVQYIMISKNDSWMVYDIVIEGVSLLRNYIEQFKSILRKDKYVGLVKQLEDKIRQLENGQKEQG